VRGASSGGRTPFCPNEHARHGPGDSPVPSNTCPDSDTHPWAPGAGRPRHAGPHHERHRRAGGLLRTHQCVSPPGPARPSPWLTPLVAACRDHQLPAHPPRSASVQRAEHGAGDSGHRHQGTRPGPPRRRPPACSGRRQAARHALQPPRCRPGAAWVCKGGGAVGDRLGSTPAPAWTHVSLGSSCADTPDRIVP
jgi:hypothetical protein